MAMWLGLMLGAVVIAGSRGPASGYSRSIGTTKRGVQYGV